MWSLPKNRSPKATVATKVKIQLKENLSQEALEKKRVLLKLKKSNNCLNRKIKLLEKENLSLQNQISLLRDNIFLLRMNIDSFDIKIFSLSIQCFFWEYGILSS